MENDKENIIRPEPPVEEPTEPTALDTPTVPPKKSKMGRKQLIIAGVIVLLIALGVAAYFVFAKENSDKPAAQESASTETQKDKDEENEEPAEVVTPPKKNDKMFSFTLPEGWSEESKPFDPVHGTETLVKSPGGLVLSIDQNIGGRGGTCEAGPTDKPHNTELCNTLEILSKEKIAAQSKEPEEDIYLFVAKFTRPRVNGTPPTSTYGLFLSSNKEEIAATAPLIGLWVNQGTIHNFTYSIPLVDTKLVAGDLTNPDVINSPDFLKMKDVLRSFKIK